MTIEQQIREMILLRYKSVREFVTAIDMPYSTFDTILKRGVNNASIGNILKICKALNISADELAKGQIVPISETDRKKHQFNELNEISAFLKITLLSNKNIKSNGDKLTNDDIQTLIDGFELSCELVRRKVMRRVLTEEIG